jgi:hypothetical protein
MNADGCLGKTSEGKIVIYYSDAVSRERARFTIAHEIGHIILAEVQGDDVRDPSFRDVGGNDAEEAAVNRIAAELLMPDAVLRDFLRTKQGSWDLIWHIKRRLFVSTTALLHRLLELTGLPVVFVRVSVTNGTESACLRCRTSQQPQILFGRPLEQEIERILADAHDDKPTPLNVYFGEDDQIIELASRFFTQNAKTECWSIGWQVFR